MSIDEKAWDNGLRNSVKVEKKTEYEALAVWNTRHTERESVDCECKASAYHERKVTLGLCSAKFPCNDCIATIKIKEQGCQSPLNQSEIQEGK